MSTEQIITEEARLIILKELRAQSNQAMTSEAARRVLLAVFILDKPREWVERQYAYLADMGAVTLTRAASVCIARLTERGEQHARGLVTIAGVQRPSEVEL